MFWTPIPQDTSSDTHDGPASDPCPVLTVAGPSRRFSQPDTRRLRMTRSSLKTLFSFGIVGNVTQTATQRPCCRRPPFGEGGWVGGKGGEVGDVVTSSPKPQTSLRFGEQIPLLSPNPNWFELWAGWLPSPSQTWVAPSVPPPPLLD